jgi:hypothetical protein
VIDFDKAFKVLPTMDKDSAYDCTKELLNFWLSFRFDLKPLGFLSSYESEKESSADASSTNYNQTDIISFMFPDAD